MQQEKKNSLLKRIFKIYRVVIYNEHLEEKVSLTLSPMNLILFFSILVSLTFLFAFVFIAYTPVREIIPGLSPAATGDVESMYKLERRADSLENILILREKEMNRLKMILNGNFSDSASSFSGSFPKEERQAIFRFAASRDLSASKTCPNFYNNKNNVNIVFASQQAGVFPPQGQRKNQTNPLPMLFAPLEGYITAGFDAPRNHYAVDIVSRHNAPVKATLDGSVIFAEWSATTGNVIILQHAHNLVSVYKHNAVLLKKVGNFVRAGEVIALVGNSGELTSGPHLHFELWSKGSPLNPEEFISF